MVVVKKFIEMGGNIVFKEELVVSMEGSSYNKEFLFGDKLVIVFDWEDVFYFLVFVYYFFECYLELMGVVWFFFEVVDNFDYLVFVVDCYVNFGLRICLEFVSFCSWDKSKKNDI